MKESNEIFIRKLKKYIDANGFNDVVAKAISKVVMLDSSYEDKSELIFNLYLLLDGSNCLNEPIFNLLKKSYLNQKDTEYCMFFIQYAILHDYSYEDLLEKTIFEGSIKDLKLLLFPDNLEFMKYKKLFKMC